MAALAATLLASANKPGVAPLAVPAGYKAVSDGVFAYAVPSGWSTSSTYSDDAGDLDTAGPQGWVAEHVDTRTQAPILGETPPATFADFGQQKPTPYQVGGGQATRLSGMTVAFRYQITRPGFRATAIDAWQSKSAAEIWLLIDADSDHHQRDPEHFHRLTTDRSVDRRSGHLRALRKRRSGTRCRCSNPTAGTDRSGSR